MPNLDDELFDEINENARNMISQVYPQWTNYNKSDAGITFIELFSWFKEMQQYYLNQMSDIRKEKYLILLGMKKNDKRYSEINVEARNYEENDVTIPAYTRMFTDDICFETENSEIIMNNEIENIVLSNGDVKYFSSESDRLVVNRMMHIFPFGEKCKENDEFEIAFKNKIPYNSEFNLYFSIYNDYPVKRNPINKYDEFTSLGLFKVSCLTIKGWKEVDIISDETYSFLQSGNIRLKIPENTEEMLNQNGYRIKFTLTKCDYDVSPAITELKMNVFKAVQRKTLSDYYDFVNFENYEIILPPSERVLSGEIDVYLKSGDKFINISNFETERYKNTIKIKISKLIKYKFDMIRVIVYDKNFYDSKVISKGTGFPYQEINMENKNIIGKQFSLMIYDSMDNAFYEWQRTENFDCSEPDSRHYVFDEINGIIKFGDGERGMSPDGDITVIECAETLDVNGAVKSNILKNYENDRIDFIKINTIYAGRKSETVHDCLKRFSYLMGKFEKNVTFEDFEKCVYNTPGLMIKQCKAVVTEPFSQTNGVTLIVQPYSEYERPKLSQSYINNIIQFTDKKRLIGTKINVISPQYVGIDIYADVCTKSHYTNSYEIIKNAVEELFKGNNFSMGDIVSYSSIYHTIDILECVSYVKSLDITATGSHYKIADNGDIKLSKNGIPYLNYSSYTISEQR